MEGIVPSLNRRVSLSNKLTLDPSTLPTIKFVKTDKYSVDYDVHRDIVSVNLNETASDKAYLTVLGIMESSHSPRRKLRLFNTARIFDNNLASRKQHNIYYAERITCNIAALIMLAYLGKYKDSRRVAIYDVISDACNQCKLSNGAPPIISMLEVYRIC